MRKQYWIWLATLGLLAMSGLAHANLIVSGTGTMAEVQGNYQLIYDTDLNITWLDYTYTNVGTPYWGRDGNAKWATDLVVVTSNGVSYDDWRLPSTVDESRFTKLTQDIFIGTTSTGYNNPASSEMSHLFYAELGNKGTYDTDHKLVANPGLNNVGPFLNLLSDSYWSGTVNVLPSTSQLIQDNAWIFNMANGYQGITDKDLSGLHGLAVTSGHIQSQPVPEPTTMILFCTGLAGLAAVGRRKRN